MWHNFEASAMEDETISNMFSSRGIFRISSDAQVERYPVIQGSVQSGKMAISIDKSLLLLEDELVAKCSFLSFDALIEVIEVSTNGNLIVCGLSDGTVHGVYIKGALLFSVSIKMEDVGLSGSTFTNIHKMNQRIYFTCRNGSVYRLSEIDEASLESVASMVLYENESTVGDKTILDDVTLERTSKDRSFGNIDSAILLRQICAHSYAKNNQLEPCDDYDLFLAAAQRSLIWRTSANDATRIVLPTHIADFKHIYNLDYYVIALTHSGHLVEICPFTRTIDPYQLAPKEEFLIEDLLVMETSEENIELLILTKVKDEARLIKLVEYPSFKCKTEVEVPKDAWLIRQPKSAVNLYYMSAKYMKSASFPSEVEMMIVSETDPSDRLKKLIAKGRLEEAEDFGKQFELCLQPIYEAKAKHILVELCNSNINLDANKLEQTFQKLLQLLELIESKSFIKSNRMINLSSRSILERYLKEIRKRLNFEEDEKHVLEIDEQLYRLKTLAITDPYECNNDWQKFVYDNNLIKTVKSMFNTDMPTACIIWRRHASSILPNVNEDELKTLLGFIPSNSKPFDMVQWLSQFTPLVSKTHPSIMPFIADWGIEMTRKLQFSPHWPDIGLEFSTNILKTFEEITFSYSDVRRQHERNISKLRLLVNALNDLTILKSDYNMSLTLDNYMQYTIDATALSILQHVKLDQLQQLVTDFLYPIYQKKGREPVEVIQQYVAQLVASRQSSSSWLERAISCVRHIHNEDSRLECALSILQNAEVPWPECLTPLIKLRNSSHPLAIKINAEYEIQVIKIMKIKYGWTEDSSADMNLDLFSMRIVKMNLPEMLHDIRTLTKAAPEISVSANFNCCYQMARRGQIEQAHEFYKSLKTTKSDVVAILANMLESCSSLSLSNETKATEHLNQLEFFKLLLPHVEATYNQRYLLIYQRFHLKQQFKIEVKSISELIPLRRRRELLEEGVERIMGRAQATLNVFTFIASEMRDLCKLLNLSTVFGIEQICRRMNCLPLTCALAYHVVQFVDCNQENSRDFINLALELLAQQISMAKGNTQDPPSALHCVKDSDPLSFPLAYELLTSSLKYEKSRQRDLCEIIKYVRVAFINYPLNVIDKHYQGTVQEKNINEEIVRSLDGAIIALGETTLNFTNASFASLDVKPQSSKGRTSVSMFDEVDVHPGQQALKKKDIKDRLPVAKFLSRTLLLMMIEIEPENCLLLELRNMLDENLKRDLDGARTDFFESLEQLTREKEHSVWYPMAQHLLDYQKHTGHSKRRIINEGFVTVQLRRLIRNAISSKDVNFIELFKMLLADSHSMALMVKLSNDIKTDQQKMNYLTLSAMYNEYIGETDEVEKIRAKRLKLYYYLEFCKQDPSIKGKFNADTDNIEQLLKEFHNKQLDVQLLERMSRDFGFDYQKILITQIMSILSAQELRFEIKRDTFGDEELVILSNTDEMREMCQPYINEIKNIDLFTTRLKQFIEEINIYFYELYLCVINMLIYFNAAPKEMEIWTNILHFLRHKMITRRASRPGQLEIEMSQNSVLPKIAQYRLPFKPIVEKPLKDILDYDINVDNCQSWFPLIQMCTALKGSKDSPQNCDYFCMSAVKNSMDELKCKSNSETWSLRPTNNAFLQAVLRLAKNMNSHNKAFLMLYYVSNYVRGGADQVEAAYECWKFAKEHALQLNDPMVKEKVIKIRSKYPKQKTMLLLHTYGLTDEKLLQLVSDPRELISSLYHHELIIKSGTIDINALVKEIADLHELDLDAIQFSLLQKWLSVTMEQTDVTVHEETLVEDPFGTPNDGIDAVNGLTVNIASENVIRAVYILSSWPKSEAVKFLIGFIFKGGSVNTSTQLQMYECFLKLNDGSNIFADIITQRQFITIKCVDDLKALGYNCNIDKFKDDQCNKIDILKMIWQRNAQNPLSLVVMANICLGFDIHLPKIWNGILKRMVIFHMVQELNALLDELSCKAQLLHLDGLAVAWDYVLCHPLKNASHTRSFELDEQLNRVLLRLQGCPVVHALNLQQFAQHCQLIQRPHMAAALLVFCQSFQQREDIKKLILSRPMDNLREQILDLENAGILPVCLDFALKELNL
ncbi:kinetochore-associated protein 1 [Drosophila tropicalis]|uniref:kinetochore-associated protein 1 n=1 Tax=Drosophila tropicalis TaxID=46794 RepID=UPI0035ABFA60